MWELNRVYTSALEVASWQEHGLFNPHKCLTWGCRLGFLFYFLIQSNARG